MKSLIVLIFVSISIYSQDHSINCDSLFYFHSQHSAVWKMPELIGGLDSLQGRLRYPDEAEENCIEGKVYILTIVDSVGEPICAKVIKGLGYGCDEEALFLVNTTEYYPGEVRNKPIITILAISVIFSLTDDK